MESEKKTEYIQFIVGPRFGAVNNGIFKKNET